MSREISVWRQRLIQVLMLSRGVNIYIYMEEVDTDVTRDDDAGYIVE